MKHWYIYKITSPKGRVYIGRTCDMKRRMERYSYLDCIEQTAIYRSIKKHGWESHKYEVIDEFDGTNSECNSKEIFWVRTYMSNIRKYPKMKGLNLTDGGGGTHGYKHTDKAKKAISDKKIGIPNYSWVGKFHSEETKKKMSKKLIGNQRWLCKTHSKETKEKMSISSKGKNSKKIIQYNLDGTFIKEWNSITEASKYMNCDISTISLNVREKTKKAKGFIFKYK